ncbi:pkb-activating kinase-like protein [Puccinia graminis f. sp. tritici]|uniref:Pkb-activating kinase-like protein n=1 Tax=Puccinia graminis f. sp. tritici TaxID=56615 RepID=A0A5B0MG96_PUCGR|nr:pkb-activating kinase-like protein [Puccinia graminis f. sp. tritici]
MVESLRGKKKKKRQLILTDFPRLLCVKEDGQELEGSGESGRIEGWGGTRGEWRIRDLPRGIVRPPLQPHRPRISHTLLPLVTPPLLAVIRSSPKLASPRAPSVEPLHPSPHQHHLLPNQLLLFKKAEIENPRCLKSKPVPIEYNNNSKNNHNAKPHQQQQQQQQQQKCCWFRFEDKSDAAQRWTDEINLAFQVANNKTHKK